MRDEQKENGRGREGEWRGGRGKRREGEGKNMGRRGEGNCWEFKEKWRDITKAGEKRLTHEMRKENKIQYMRK